MLCSAFDSVNYWREGCHFRDFDIVVANSCFHCYSVGATSENSLKD